MSLAQTGKCQEKIPPTSVHVSNNDSKHTNEYLENRILGSELNTPSLARFLITAQYDRFIEKGLEFIQSNSIKKEEKETILNTIISIHSLRYEYQDISDLREEYHLDKYNLSLNWNEIDFFKQYTTKVELEKTLPIKLPLKWSIAKTPMVEVEIDGQKFSFWLDIGASGSVISSTVANKINAIESNVKITESAGSTDNVFSVKPAIIQNLAIGEITLKNLPVAIIDIKELTLAPGITIDGIIGLPFLFDYTTTIDNEKSILTLSRNEKYIPTQKNFFWIGYPILELHLLNGNKTYWGFDTGAGTSRIKDGLLQKLDSTYQIKPIQIKESGVGGLTDKFQSFMLPDFTIFCKDIPIVFKNIKSTTPEGVRTELIDADGKIGSDVVYHSKGVKFSFNQGFFKFIE